VNAFLQELLHAAIYKRSQGRITRQVTWFALAAAVALGFWRLSQTAIEQWEWHPSLGLGIPTVLAALGCWVAFRLVNFPRFADFLIAVEAEMNKVSWPTRGELVRSSLVVLFTIFALAVVLFGFDFIWNAFFRDVLKIL
jgi:preprotein translocase subunit SecE